MSEFGVETDAGDAGFDAARLARIDRVMQRYVDEEKLPGWLVVVSRGGRIAHLSSSGWRDVAERSPVTADTVWRLYSMTKPVVSVAVMMLYEEGALQLTDPVSRFLPSFAEQRVLDPENPRSASDGTVAAERPVTVWHLLTHTAGLTYGFHRAHPVDAMLRELGFEWGTPEGCDLATAVDLWARLPLLFQPGAEWNYSLATDVLGRLVEVVSGQRLDVFLRERVFGPLGMTDTGFHLSDEAAARLATLYVHTPDGMRKGGGSTDRLTKPPVYLSGGGGLMGTARDYHRFTQMLRGGGAYDGVRLLGPRTVRYMTRNHLPGGAFLSGFGRPMTAETPFEGTGFGLGFSVVEDPAALHGLASRGEYGWGGAAGTAFWVDPAEDVTALFFTQLLPPAEYPLRTQLRTLVQQALTD